jgi:hypothetical protein
MLREDAGFWGILPVSRRSDGRPFALRTVLRMLLPASGVGKYVLLTV